MENIERRGIQSICINLHHRCCPRRTGDFMSNKMDPQALDQLFRLARTRNGWTDRPVAEAQIRELYDLLKLGPTSANSCPARFVWVRTAEGKGRLAALVSRTNKPKVLAAPVTVIVGYDLDFAERLPELFPARGEKMQEVFRDEALAKVTAQRNSSLQGGYLIMAARALGLDTGPMSGFDNDRVDAEYFAGTRIKSNFICSLGYGSDENLFPRNPRLSFEEAGRFA
jgi:3-hydroxypropanoate dehydrogenase